MGAGRVIYAAPPQPRRSTWVIRHAFNIFIDQPRLILVPIQALAATVILIAIALAFGVGGLAVIIRSLQSGAGRAVRTAGLVSSLIGLVLLLLTFVYIAAATWGCLVDAAEGSVDPWKFWSYGSRYFGRACAGFVCTLLIGLAASVLGILWFTWPAVLLGGLGSLTFALLWILPGTVGCMLIYFGYTLIVLMLWPALFASRDVTKGFAVAVSRWRDVFLLWLFLQGLGVLLIVLLFVGLLTIAMTCLAGAAFATFGSLAALIYYRSAVGLAVPPYAAHA